MIERDEGERLRLVLPTLETWRCPNCGTILAKVSLPPGSIVEIKCKRCNSFAVKQIAA